jgi:ABC-type transport system involved in cytochrome bd biosynthesis fused ATPase/permease subunit
MPKPTLFVCRSCHHSSEERPKDCASHTLHEQPADGDRLSNNLSGIATIKSFTAEAYESDRVYQDSEAYCRDRNGLTSQTISISTEKVITILTAFVITFFAEFYTTPKKFKKVL